MPFHNKNLLLLPLVRYGCRLNPFYLNWILELSLKNSRLKTYYCFRNGTLRNLPVLVHPWVY